MIDSNQFQYLISVAPPGFGGMVAQDQGDGLSILDNAMPLSVDDLERQHLERQQLAQLAQQQQQQRNYENGLTPIGTKPINNDGIDDPGMFFSWLKMILFSIILIILTKALFSIFKFTWVDNYS